MLALVLAAAVTWSAIAADGQPWQRLVARALFAVVLLWLARLAWRRPAGRAGRLRRRMLRLIAVLARPDLQREWAESSPSTDLAEALLADWRRAAAVSDADIAAAFPPDEARDVVALRADLEILAARLPPGDGAAGSPAWADIVDCARKTHDALARKMGTVPAFGR